MVDATYSFTRPTFRILLEVRIWREEAGEAPVEAHHVAEHAGRVAGVVGRQGRPREPLGHRLEHAEDARDKRSKSFFWWLKQK